MKILILGGTVFLGRHIVDAARAEGHEVTLFNRGKSGPKIFPDIETILGDRGADLAKLHGRRWGAVIDTCGYFPKVVGRSAEVLRDQTDCYVFISTVSVYKDMGTNDRDESAPVQEPLDVECLEYTGETYGPLKAACERAVAKAMPDKALIVRPGLIGGPHDPTDRFTYWPSRVAEGGKVLAPGDPERLVQVIDVRDLAQWIVRMAGRKKTGTFNACGKSVFMRDILNLCKEASESNASLDWVPGDFLLKRKVEPWTEMPLWNPGVNDVRASARARERGLTWRPLSDTIRDTLAWDSSRPKDLPRKNGLDRAREAVLLAQWRNAKMVMMN